ncbi:uncharacterized protein ARMOST_11665 [Armillaria ostoyae]|uniref:Ribonuclease H1 N-terminal domain-containing protein n=1 Tax=Armillaria ostoyae TaxID=47428 RepID=A0A284RHS6_ARMOS|nr:uncharacterized protein ARMOST_11665 [Armillaria ostoyae]
MSETSVPLSSVSSLQVLSCSSACSSASLLPSKSKSMNGLSPGLEPFIQTTEVSHTMDKEQDYDIEVTMKMTTVTTTIHCLATPQPQTPTKYTSYFASPLLSPLRGKGAKPPMTMASSASHSLCTSAARPQISDAVSTPLFSPSKKSSVPVSGPLRFPIPHPDQICPSPYIHPPSKKWYAVTVGQDIGVFDDWLLVQELTDSVPGTRKKGFKTYEQALAL